jgi:sulfite reductase (ferredoxin)
MQWKSNFERQSEEEEIKAHGLTLDFDEIARRGAMSKEEKLIGKWYGVYASRHPGQHMARVVIPGGVLSTTQARNIAGVAERHGQGRLNLTTRQAIQFHWLKVGALPDLFRELAEDGNTTFHGCGDVVRAVTACPMAESCPYKRLNVRPWAIRTQKALNDSRDLDNLPRKFKITFSGCPAACAQPYMNCVGHIAVQRGSECGFKVVIGGGMGWEAYVAQELFSFVPEARIIQITRAIALLYRDHGDRFNRQKSRLKFVVARLGIEACRQKILAYLQQEGADTAGLSWTPFEESGRPFPDRPLALDSTVGTDGRGIVRVMIHQGELDHRPFRALAELADIYGDQKLYTTNRQNIEIHGLEPAKIPEVEHAVHTLGFETDGFYTLRDMVACVGTTYCPKAVATTRDLHALLQAVVRKPEFAAIQKQAIINITGCPNSCSPYRIADLGFRGMRIREEAGSVEGFECTLGGDQQKHGQKLGEFKTPDIPEVVHHVLTTFIHLRTPAETLTRTVNRVGIAPFQKAVFS